MHPLSKDPRNIFPYSLHTSIEKGRLIHRKALMLAYAPITLHFLLVVGQKWPNLCTAYSAPPVHGIFAWSMQIGALICSTFEQEGIRNGGTAGLRIQ